MPTTVPDPSPPAAGAPARASARRRPPAWAALAPALLLVALLAAGCGGGARSPAVANIGATTSSPSGQAASPSSPPPLSSARETAVDDAYAACIDGHGLEARAIPGGGVGFIVRPGLPGPGSPRFVAAQKACAKLLPKGGLPKPTAAQVDARVAGMLRLAECMRSHGVPSFPDPTANGSLFIQPGDGIDPSSTSFQAAQKSCARYFPGGAPPPPT